jgi:diguanylate cyclase (GGDEF)-like protein/putative nucleotidyltransferase with HDIG domain
MEAQRKDQFTPAEANGSLFGRLRDLLARPRPSPPEEENGEAEAERRAFGDQLALEVERGKRGARHLSVLIGELSTHRNHGSLPFTSADDALLITAHVVAGEKRRIDTAARVGDNRFALILPETAEQGALVLAERLRAAIANAFGDGAGAPAVSFGIATFPRHGRTAGALVKAADRALEAVRMLGGEGALVESAETPATMVSVGSGDELSDQWLATVLALAETVDIRDHGTTGHSQTVGRYAERIARELGLSVKIADRVRLAGLLHDVGKIGVPESILQKPASLEEGEWELVRKHSEIGTRLLDDRSLEDVKKWVLAHHERPDGLGYPRGLTAETIPLEARIVAVADAYESMTTNRPYRATLSHEAAQAELIEHSGRQFDRRVVDAFMRTLEREGLRARRRLTGTF